MNLSLVEIAEVPDGVVTVISTVATDETAGDTAVIELGELTVKLDAAILPKSTEVTLVKSEPVIFTVVPPVVGPDEGVIELTDGGGGANPTIATPIVEVFPCPTAKQNVELVQETP